MHRSNLDFHGTAQLLRLGIAATVPGADYNPVAAPSEYLAIERRQTIRAQVVTRTG